MHELEEDEGRRRRIRARGRWALSDYSVCVKAGSLPPTLIEAIGCAFDNPQPWPVNDQVQVKARETLILPRVV